jgi:hypothetical protein
MKKILSLSLLALIFGIAVESCGGTDSFYDVEITDVDLDQHYVSSNRSESRQWDSLEFSIGLGYKILSAIKHQNKPRVIKAAMASDESMIYYTIVNPVESFILSTKEHYNDSLGRNLSTWIQGEYFEHWKHERHYYSINPFHFQVLAPPKNSGYFSFELTTYLKSGEVYHSTLDSVLISK